MGGPFKKYQVIVPDQKRVARLSRASCFRSGLDGTESFGNFRQITVMFLAGEFQPLDSLKSSDFKEK